LFTAPVQADRVVLLNGQVIEGEIIHGDDSFVSIQTDKGIQLISTKTVRNKASVFQIIDARRDEYTNPFQGRPILNRDAYKRRGNASSRLNPEASLSVQFDNQLITNVAVIQIVRDAGNGSSLLMGFEFEHRPADLTTYVNSRFGYYIDPASLDERWHLSLHYISFPDLKVNYFLSFGIGVQFLPNTTTTFGKNAGLSVGYVFQPHSENPLYISLDIQKQFFTASFESFENWKDSYTSIQLRFGIGQRAFSF